MTISNNFLLKGRFHIIYTVESWYFQHSQFLPKYTPIALPLVWDIGYVLGECQAAIISICPMGIFNSLDPGGFQFNFR